VLGRPLPKPTWSSAFGVFNHVGFFYALCDVAHARNYQGMPEMPESELIAAGIDPDLDLARRKSVLNRCQ
jgi:hypothetical protein